MRESQSDPLPPTLHSPGRFYDSGGPAAKAENPTQLLHNPEGLTSLLFLTMGALSVPPIHHSSGCQPLTFNRGLHQRLDVQVPGRTTGKRCIFDWVGKVPSQLGWRWGDDASRLVWKREGELALDGFSRDRLAGQHLLPTP